MIQLSENILSRLVKMLLALLVFCCFSAIYGIELQAQEINVLSGMSVHEGASVGLFDDITNADDTLHNNGHISLIEGSIYNEEPLVGTGTVEICGNDVQDILEGADVVVDTLIVENGSGEDIKFENDIYVNSAALFNEGILNDFMDTRDNPSDLFYVQFGADAASFNESDASHVDGVVKKEGTTSFLFPIGDKGYYRPAQLYATGNSETFAARYYYEYGADVNSFPEANIPDQTYIQREEFWYLESTNNSVELDLTYDSRTSAFSITEYDPLAIVAYDGFLDNSLTLLDATAISAPTDPEQVFVAQIADNSDKRIWFGFGGEDIETGEIPQLITPDNNGKNDFFVIPNIDEYENNRILIFNRYGVTVFEMEQYDNSWDGRSNKPVVGQTGSVLPTGTYYVFFYNDGKLIYKDFVQLVINRL